jgi:uncharacterized protein YjbI with pentapeptide repeats
MEHKRCVYSEGKDGARASLAEHDLRRYDLLCVDLRGAGLKGADFKGANLRNADLGEAHLARATGWRAFCQKIRERIRQKGCFRGVLGLVTDYHDARLQSAELRGANLAGATLRGADLTRANLQGADLQGADLQDAVLRGADLTEAQLQKAKLPGAELHGVDLSRATLRGADLTGAKLPGADLQGADLQDTVLRGADLTGAKLPGADFQGADLQDTVLRGADLLEAHLRGVARWRAWRRKRASGQKSFLRGVLQDWHDAGLQRAQLRGANLARADLEGAQLRGADLTEAQLQKAKLRGAELHGVDLSRATLDGADLTEADLHGAILQKAKFANARGLLLVKLAAADLRNADLPSPLDKFDDAAKGTLEHVSETSRNAGTVFFTMLAACAYSWLTIATTTDVELLAGSKALKLPIIDTEIPTVGFYVAAPLLLLAVYCYLHLYLQRLWVGLSRLPAWFPDGLPLHEKVYPWLLTGLVRSYIMWLRPDRPFTQRLESWISTFLAWWIVPLTLLWFWERSWPRHGFYFTVILAVLGCVGVIFGLFFYSMAGRTLHGHEYLHRRRKFAYFASGVAVVGIIGALSLGALCGYRGVCGLDGSFPTGVSSTLDWLGRTFDSRGLTYAYLYEADLRNADLEGMNLIGADLRKAQLQGADLSQADLLAADLSGADLRDAQGLTQERLDCACGDEETKLPEPRGKFDIPLCRLSPIQLVDISNAGVACALLRSRP